MTEARPTVADVEQLMRDLDAEARRLFVPFVQQALMADFPTAAEITKRLERLIPDEMPLKSKSR